jgi:hypothetical protein
VGRDAAAVALAILLGGLLTVAAPAEAAGRRPYGGELQIGLEGGVTTSDPALARSDGEVLLAVALHQPLLRVEESGEVVPVLVEAVPEVSEPGLRWSARLRPGLRFQDGTPIGADDVARSLDRLGSSAVGSELAWLAAAVTVEPDGADPLRFELRARTPLREEALWQALALPQAAILAGGQPAERAGAGPFRLVAGPGRAGRFELAAFEAHAEGRPFLDALTLVILASADEERELFYYDQLDVAFRKPRRAHPAVEVSGPVAATLVLERGESLGRAGFRAVASRIRPAALVPYVDTRCEVARGPLPGVQVAPDAEGTAPPSGPLRVGFAAGDAAWGADRVASAVRDLLVVAGASGSTSGREGPEAADLRLRVLRWHAASPEVAGPQLRYRLTHDAHVAAALLTVAEGAPGVERSLSEPVRRGDLLPLVHLRPVAWVRPDARVEGLRFGVSGTLRLDVAWTGGKRR